MVVGGGGGGEGGRRIRTRAGGGLIGEGGRRRRRRMYWLVWFKGTYHIWAGVAACLPAGSAVLGSQSCPGSISPQEIKNRYLMNWSGLSI